MGMIINPYLVQPSGDADAQAFITATGITDSTQKSAIETLVTDLKGYGIWTKMKALYPFVGGTSTTHSYNLINTAQYQLTFSGGWTHSSTGADPNGTNAYADTGLSNNTMGQNDVSFSVYLGEDNPGDGSSTCAIGVYGLGYGSAIYPGNGLGNSFFILNGAVNILGVNSDNKSRGLYLASKTASEAFVNVRGILTTTTFSTSNLKTNNFILNRAGDFNGDYNAQQQRFASIGNGLTSTEAANFYTAVQAFQTTLSRNV